MSATNSTTNYQLPQFIQTDKPSWLGDFNGAMRDIDTQMKSNADGVTANAANITTLGNTVSTNTSDISDLESALSTLNTTVTSQGTDIETIHSDITTLSEPITTSRIDDEAVTAAKIDFTTFDKNINSTAIDDDAVTSDKIDWTTIGRRETHTTSAVIANGTNWTDCGPSITITTPGTYFFIGKASLEARAEGNKHGLIRIYNNTTSTQIGEIADFFGLSTGLPGGVANLVTFGIATVTANSAIKLQFRSATTASAIACSIENSSYPSLSCFRIGSANA